MEIGNAQSILDIATYRRTLKYTNIDSKSPRTKLPNLKEDLKFDRTSQLQRSHMYPWAAVQRTLSAARPQGCPCKLAGFRRHTRSLRRGARCHGTQIFRHLDCRLLLRSRCSTDRFHFLVPPHICGTPFAAKNRTRPPRSIPRRAHRRRCTPTTCTRGHTSGSLPLWPPSICPLRSGHWEVRKQAVRAPEAGERGLTGQGGTRLQ